MRITTTWPQIWQMIQDEWGDEDISEEMYGIRAANRVLKDWRREMDLESVIKMDYLYFISDYEKYKIPSDMKEGAIIDIRKQEGSQWTPFALISPTTFRLLQSGMYISRQINAGVEFFKILNSNDGAIKVVINEADATTGWTASGGASNITADTDEKKHGTGSLNFDIASATAPVVTLALTTAVDCSDLGEKLRVRFYFRFPTITNLTNAVAQFGSTSANYIQQTLTSQASGEAFSANEWNELELIKQDATETGTVDYTSITHCKITLTYSSAATATDFRLDYIVAFKGDVLETEYYSYNTVKPTAASTSWQDGLTESLTDSDNEIPLLYDEWIPTFVDDILVRLLGPEENTRRSEFFNRALAGKNDIMAKFPSRRKRYQRSWKLPHLPTY